MVSLSVEYDCQLSEETAVLILLTLHLQMRTNVIFGFFSVQQLWNDKASKVFWVILTSDMN